MKNGKKILFAGWIFLSIIVFIVCILFIRNLLDLETYKSIAKKRESKITQLETRNDFLLDTVNKFDNEKKETALRKEWTIVLYIKTNFPRTPQTVAEEIARSIIFYSEIYEIPYEVIIGIMEQESSFNPLAVGSDGERGLMQVRPIPEGKSIGILNKYELHDIDRGIWAGFKIFKIKLEKFGTIDKAIGFYNGDTRKYVGRIYRRIGKFTTFISSLPVKNLKDSVSEDVIKKIESSNTVNISYILYTITPGDTLSGLAKVFLGSKEKWEAIQVMNPDVDPLRLKIGEQIMIPLEEE